MTQLTRLNLGDDVEEAHMRNRQWVSAWVFEKGKDANVIEKVKKDGKTYLKINDYDKLRELFGALLKETQRIKSEGDFDAAKNLVENYGVKVDQEIHKEVLERSAQFPEMNEAGEITTIKVTQPESFEEQMLMYSKEYGFLPEMN